MKKISYKFYFFALVVVSCILRLLFLGTWPPDFSSNVGLRYLTAVTAVVSILLLTLIVKRVTKNDSLSLLTGFIFAICPWHIEQSRIVSPPMWGLTMILCSILLLTMIKKRLFQLLVLALTIYAFSKIDTTYWIFHDQLVWPGLYPFSLNLFKLVSIEFLFYKNDSFWWGGLRTLGVFTPGFLPFFIAGCLDILAHFKRQYWKWVAVFCALWILAASNPKFPEGRAFFLTLPFFAIICGDGARVFLTLITTKIRLTKIAIWGLLLFFLYDYILFMHFYINHYSIRIQNERVEHQLQF